MSVSPCLGGTAFILHALARLVGFLTHGHLFAGQQASSTFTLLGFQNNGLSEQ